MNEPLKLLFKFPCRGRKEMLIKSLDSLVDNIRDRENYYIALTLDTNDLVLNNQETIEKLLSYPRTHIFWGESYSKVDAINRSMPDCEWDVIICWSNDMFATFYGFDDIMRLYILQACMNGGMDALIHFPEPDTKDILNVLYVATRKYYERFNYIYHPSYLSLFCDNETMCVAQLLGRYHYIGTTGLYEHRNPAYSHHGMERDELFDYQQSLWGLDEANFHARKAKNFDLKLF